MARIIRGRTYDWAETAEGSTNSQAAKAALGDGGIDDSLVAEPVQQAFGHLVGAIVLSHLFAENEYVRIRLKLLSQSFVEGVANSVFLHTSGLGVTPVLVTGAANSRCSGEGRGEMKHGWSRDSFDSSGSSRRRGQASGRSKKESGHGRVNVLIGPEPNLEEGGAGGDDALQKKATAGLSGLAVAVFPKASWILKGDGGAGAGRTKGEAGCYFPARRGGGKNRVLTLGRWGGGSEDNPEEGIFGTQPKADFLVGRLFRLADRGAGWPLRLSSSARWLGTD